jgi:hypothetical protein
MIATAQTRPKLFSDSTGNPVGVDREKNILRGFVVAKTGPFKTGRGRFDGQSLAKAVQLLRADPQGVRSRFNHPSPDGAKNPLGRFLGRVKNPRVDGDLLRADLYLDPTAMEQPPGGGRPLGDYLLHLAETDHRAAGASMVLKANKTLERDSRGRPVTDKAGNELPLWIPSEIQGVDFCDEGDATLSLLGRIPMTDDDPELFRLRWRNMKRRAGISTSEPDAELLRMKWENKKRKAGILR